MASPGPADPQSFAAARERVLATIAAACSRAGRDPADVTLVAVSKTVPPERLVAAVAAGLTILGENRVQEAEEKAALVDGATWHLVGPLQSNKARRALTTFDVIESVDSVELAERLDRLADEVRPTERVPVLLQVNVDGDAAKAGFDPDALGDVLPRLAGLARLELRGLMTVGRLVERAEDARSTFVALRALSERLRGAAGSAASILGAELSMGMSDDYPVAIEEGATIVRVGRALFGERPDHDH
jgi:pyridoxal phosphate enzyme (YggS family)